MTRPQKHAIVVNAGNHPEPAYLALALMRKGWQVEYLTATRFTSDSLVMRIAGSDLFRSGRLGRLAKRRMLPLGFNRKNTRRLAQLSEAVAMIARLIGGRQNAWSNSRRTRAFEIAASRYVSSRQSEIDLIVGQYTGVRSSFLRAPDAAKLLMYPLPHQAWMESALTEASLRRPEWADLLQGLSMDERLRRVIDDELSAADHILVPSSFARNTFIEAGLAPSDVTAVPLGVDLELAMRVREVVSPPQDRTDGAPLRALFVGQVNERKGLSYLLEACSHLGPQAVSLSLFGECAPAVRRRVRDLVPWAEFLGGGGSDEVLRTMASHDVLILPSLAEGFGLVVLEAMAVGTPSIVSDRTLAGDVIESGVNGWIVPAEDAAALEALLGQLSADPDLPRKCGERAATRASEFGWVVFGDRAAAVCESLVGGAHGR